ncbi:hypothetical protein ACFQVC_23010 [Streptomyces monticola]|uniref:Uncharacterized protein n=1 Tax=Streptomyces monticola TaxID=2666263 RepID=A0ABW2JNC8_9ACTN
MLKWTLRAAAVLAVVAAIAVPVAVPASEAVVAAPAVVSFASAPSEHPVVLKGAPPLSGWKP